jgi:hypothetical protein
MENIYEETQKGTLELVHEVLVLQMIATIEDTT